MKEDNDIMVLREMVRLAESRRTEMLTSLERVNKYNLALIAFAGGFLSLIVTTDVAMTIVRVAGFLLLLSMFLSILAVRPKTLRAVTLTIDEDVKIFQNGQSIALKEYLLLVAEITDAAATNLNKHGTQKKYLTIISACCLVSALWITYSIYAYA